MLGITQLTSATQTSPVNLPSVGIFDSLFSWKYVGIASAVTAGSAYAYSVINYIAAVRKANKIKAEYQRLSITDAIKEFNEFFAREEFVALIRDRADKNSELNNYLDRFDVRQSKLQELHNLLTKIKSCIEDMSVLTNVNSAFRQLLHLECQVFAPIKNVRFKSNIHRGQIDEALWHLPIGQIQELLEAIIERNNKTNFFKRYVTFSGFTNECNEIYVDMITSYHALQTYAKILDPSTSIDELKRVLTNYTKFLASKNPSSSGS